MPDAAHDLACFAEADLRPRSPLAALEYFRKLVPTLGVDPQRWGESLERHAFTLAIATEDELLRKVQAALAAHLERSPTLPPVGATVYPERLRSGPEVIDALLDEAGVSPHNSSYGELIYRTNTMESLNAGAQRELQAPDVIDDFPAWQYLAVVDGRERPKHGAKNRQYYPSTVPFTSIRGTDIGDVANCRCTFKPIWKTAWKKLQAQGAAFSSFAEQAAVPAFEQETPSSCGASALFAVAERFGVAPPSEAAMRLLLGTTEADGTPPPAMIAGAQELGLDVVAAENMTLPQLERALLRGWPVIVCLQAWASDKEWVDELESGHWAVAQGRDKRKIYFSDPATGGEDWIPRDEFLQRWVDRDGAGKVWTRFGIIVKGTIAT